MAKMDDLKAKLIETISDEIAIVDKDIEKLEVRRGKLEDKINLLKTRL